MKNIIKKTIKAVCIAGVFVAGMIVGSAVTQKEQVVQEVQQVQEKEPVSKTYHVSKGNLTEYSDGSWSIVGDGEYIFQPANLGDWDYELESEEELKNIIDTYMTLKDDDVKNVTATRRIEKDNGDIYMELSDGSWSIENVAENIYVFQPADLGDWSYVVDNSQQLNNVIETYISIKNTGMY